MKKLIALFFIFICGIAGAQTYSNNWIDYNKTYYKFSIGTDGLYHITQSALNFLGLSNIPAEQFQLWRNGAEVPLYTSVSTGPLPANGYIEFWGQTNDGKMDTKLYINPDYQLSDHYSLQTDTAAYFLTVNPEGNYFKNQINPGFASLVGSYVYSSSYDIGEGWTSNDIYPAQPLQAGFNNLNVYTGGPGFSVKFGVAGNAYNERNVRVKVFTSVIDDESMPYFNYLKKDVTNLPISLLSDPNNVSIFFENTSSVSTDRMVVSFDEITYPS